MNTQGLPTLAEFWDMLNRFDWFYHYSDDHKYYKAGETGIVRLKSIAAHGGSDYLKLMDDFRNAVFSGPAFKSEKIEKPKRPIE